MPCSSCGGDLAADVRFCPACGTPAQISDATTRARSAAPRPHTRAPSTDPIDNARFIPGTVLSGRYRIVTMLGRGGMGEVYRADDLKLGQPVALKFLPEDFAHHAERLARFHQEVRVARQVSHPNVCRVYDIGEVDVDASHLHFLSMEYVDGEDLASLLRRIGRLPSDKALQVARQLCAGLAAAHDRGVLHRDLKPANALLDSHGRVRIADFGLASLVEERRDPHLLAGTPAYMAPEQLAGQGASTRTDVYALGLILYEIFTGKAVHAPAAAAVAGSSRESSRPTHLSAFAPDVDPVVERVILRCLEPDPSQRPSSALAVAAALPGGDPLGAALAAGETPSPEMVAAAGERGSIAPRIGLALVAAILLGLAAVMWMSPQTTLLGLVAIEKSPEVLVDRARDFARSLGYTNPVDEAYGYEVDGGYLNYVADHDRSTTRWQVLRTEHQSAIRFWYRQSPTALTPLTFSTAPGRVTPLDPPPIDPGMVSVTMDTGGRLIQFKTVPTGRDAAMTNAPQPDWAMLFSSAGLSINDFTSAAPLDIAPISGNVRAAWTVFDKSRPETPLRVEAAATSGKLQYFEIVHAWTTTSRQRITTLLPVERGESALFLILLVIGSAGILLARRNLRLGRGDRRGAWRLAVFIFVISLLSDGISAHHTADLATETRLLMMLISLELYRAAIMWVMYVAAEPHVRRVWPETMIGWNRLLMGQFRDPRVGRDVLVGLVAGLGLSCAIHTSVLAGGVVTPLQLGPYLDIDAARAVSWLGAGLGLATLIGLVVQLELLLLVLIFRTRALAIGVLAVATTFGLRFVLFGAAGPVVGYTLAALVGLVLLMLQVRFGSLAVIAFFFVRNLTIQVPIELFPSAPYAVWSYSIIATLLVLTGVAFHISLGGRSVLLPALFNEGAERA